MITVSSNNMAANCKDTGYYGRGKIVPYPIPTGYGPLYPMGPYPGNIKAGYGINRQNTAALAG